MVPLCNFITKIQGDLTVKKSLIFLSNFCNISNYKMLFIIKFMDEPSFTFCFSMVENGIQSITKGQGMLKFCDNEVCAFFHSEKTQRIWNCMTGRIGMSLSFFWQILWKKTSSVTVFTDIRELNASFVLYSTYIVLFNLNVLLHIFKIRYVQARRCWWILLRILTVLDNKQ